MSESSARCALIYYGCHGLKLYILGYSPISEMLQFLNRCNQVDLSLRWITTKRAILMNLMLKHAAMILEFSRCYHDEM